MSREVRRREVVRRFERDVEEANCHKTAPTLEQMADEAAEVYEPYIERLEHQRDTAAIRANDKAREKHVLQAELGDRIERLEYEKSSLRLEMDALEHQRVSNNQYLLDRIERLEQVVKAWDHFEAVSCLQHPPPTEVRRARLDARRARADLEPGDFR